MVLSSLPTTRLMHGVEHDGAMSLRSAHSRLRAHGGVSPALRTQAEIEKIRSAGNIVHESLERASEACIPGACTRDLEEVVRETIENSGAEPLFLDYPAYVRGQGFPAVACISVNDAVIHGIPGRRRLESGDVVSIDCGVRLDGWCADASRTVSAGTMTPEHLELVHATKSLLDYAINQIRPGVRWSTIAAALDSVASEAGYGVVADYVGHGIGRKLHEAPSAPSVMTRSLGSRGDFTLRPGMVIAVEPMLVLIDEESREACKDKGRAVRVDTVTARDGWTVRTFSGAVSSHFEHTIAVTRSGSDVLTAGRDRAIQADESEAMHG